MPPTYYAATRAMDPGTGEVSMAGATWARGAPMVEVVLRVLRTQKGSYRPDPAFGVDYTAVQKALPNAAATWRAEVLRALQFLVDRGLITGPGGAGQPAITVDVSARGVLAYQVDFRDPRAPATARPLSTGRLAL